MIEKERYKSFKEDNSGSYKERLKLNVNEKRRIVDPISVSAFSDIILSRNIKINPKSLIII